MYIPPSLARTHTRAHQAIFELCVHLFTTTLQNTVCKWVKCEGFTPIFPSPLPSPKVWMFMHYAHFIHYEVINGHSAGRGRGRGGKIGKAENEVNKG